MGQIIFPQTDGKINKSSRNGQTSAKARWLEAEYVKGQDEIVAVLAKLASDTTVAFETSHAILTVGAFVAAGAFVTILAVDAIGAVVAVGAVLAIEIAMFVSFHQ